MSSASIPTQFIDWLSVPENFPGRAGSVLGFLAQKLEENPFRVTGSSKAIKNLLHAKEIIIGEEASPQPNPDPSRGILALGRVREKNTIINYIIRDHLPSFSGRSPFEINVKDPISDSALDTLLDEIGKDFGYSIEMGLRKELVANKLLGKDFEKCRVYYRTAKQPFFA